MNYIGLLINAPLSAVSARYWRFRSGVSSQAPSHGITVMQLAPRFVTPSTSCITLTAEGVKLLAADQPDVDPEARDVLRTIFGDPKRGWVREVTFNGAHNKPSRSFSAPKARWNESDRSKHWRHNLGYLEYTWGLHPLRLAAVPAGLIATLFGHIAMTNPTHDTRVAATVFAIIAGALGLYWAIWRRTKLGPNGKKFKAAIEQLTTINEPLAMPGWNAKLMLWWWILHPSHVHSVMQGMIVPSWWQGNPQNWRQDMPNLVKSIEAAWPVTANYGSSGASGATGGC